MSTTYPLNGITYNAEDAQLFHCNRSSGVFSAEEDFAVEITGDTQLTIGPGLAWFQISRFAGLVTAFKEDTVLELPLAHGNLPRIDRIVLRYDKIAAESYITVLTGNPGSSPAAPAITRTNLVYDLALCDVARPAGSTTITTANITSLILDETICGVMRDGVEAIPTAQLQAEARAKVAALEESATASASAAAASASAAAASAGTAGSYATFAGNKAGAANDSAAAAAASANAAEASKAAAAEFAQQTATNASAATQSQQAAAQSQTSAADSAAAAEQSRQEAAAIVSTDPSLTIEGAPADAAAVGIAIAAAQSNIYELPVPASGWTGEAAPYTNTIAVAGITEDTVLSDITLAPSCVGNAGSEAAARSWDYLDTQPGSVVLYSSIKPAADFVLWAREVR